MSKSLNLPFKYRIRFTVCNIRYVVCTSKRLKAPTYGLRKIKHIFDNINIFTGKYKQFKCTLIDHFLNQLLNWAVGSSMMEWAIVIG